MEGKISNFEKIGLKKTSLNVLINTSSMMCLKVCVGLFCDSILLIAQACSDKYTVQVCVCNACLVHIFWVISVNCPVHIMTALNAPPYL